LFVPIPVAAAVQSTADYIVRALKTFQREVKTRPMKPAGKIAASIPQAGGAQQQAL
jgi:hypothetical protein